jgi:hypothetical protein
MSKKQKQMPLTPEEVEALTTTQHLQRARHNSAYWLRRSDAILKLAHPTPGQLDAQPWYEQHGLVWGAIAEKLDRLDELEHQERAHNYQLANQD